MDHLRVQVQSTARWLNYRGFFFYVIAVIVNLSRGAGRVYSTKLSAVVPPA